MATQVNSVRSHSAGGLRFIHLDVTLITSGTTVTYSLPPFTKLYGLFFHNTTTNAINSATPTYTLSTGVWLSGTMAVNDNAIVTFITD